MLTLGYDPEEEVGREPAEMNNCKYIVIEVFFYCDLKSSLDLQ